MQIQTEWEGRSFSITYGEMATQANGAVLVRYADTVVLATAVMSPEEIPGIDFMPLTVEYREMSYAVGKIPGGFFKREMGRPSDKEVVTARLIDRPLRPLFPKGFLREVQIITTVLSADQENDPDVLAIIGASAALIISDIPFYVPIAAVRIGRKNGEWIINPTRSQLTESELNLVVAGNEEGVVMVEGEAQFVPEDTILEAIFVGYEALKPILKLQKELQKTAGKSKIEIIIPQKPNDLVTKLERYLPLIEESLSIPEKLPRNRRLSQIFAQAVQEMSLNEEFLPQAKLIFEDFERKLIREKILKGKRIDGRGLKDIRPIQCEVGILPRTHGSAIFKRGETQVLAVTTLGTTEDEQKIDALYGDSFKSFMVHYNFLPYCVGEVRPLRGPSRREIGHGFLAERALKPIIPREEEFPYTIRVVSEVLESNGSSSMATVCSGCLSLMDAGIPVKKPIAGIAMGLVKENDNIAILSDILGEEDHCGDMDFKLAGSREGVTAIQMDIKIEGISKDILHQALIQAREGRLFILDRMEAVLPAPKTSISPHAPKVSIIEIPPEKIANLIGPGGKVIKDIMAKTGVNIDIKETGKVHIVSHSEEQLKKAIEMVKQVTQEVEEGRLYIGKVKRIMDFGALVEILPGTVGLVHVSELDYKRVNKVSDILKEGDEVLVRVLKIEKDGKIKLSRKAALSPSLNLRKKGEYRY
ncbi:MAG: Polyribonucleotide nucleotidyltransferase [Candidatus Methanoperedenaceae archaeon GB50]|nr:MAG: Polyribonucleotide nucleotidyltransferase [Candidatus Methanoperedenaceae archaeon GB50]CAD7779590.1 Polyribonucleotide nucleotidyltransferase [Candidatus Methanoperedenaceae archaeon GB50]